MASEQVSPGQIVFETERSITSAVPWILEACSRRITQMLFRTVHIFFFRKDYFEVSTCVGRTQAAARVPRAMLNPIPDIAVNEPKQKLEQVLSVQNY